MKLLPTDEISNLRTRIEIQLTIAKATGDRKKFRDWCEDSILDLLLLAYTFGCEDANEMLGTEIAPTFKEMEDSVYKPIAGKTFAERIAEYAESGSVDDIMRVAETESHRVYNEASYNTAVYGGATKKTWNCMFHNSRDTHIYLHGTTVPIDAKFYTFMGNSAYYPGEFGVAEEDCNCQCVLTYSK